MEFNLAEAIRRVLQHDHYPGCECSVKLRNLCDRRRLRQALKEYAVEHPEFICPILMKFEEGDFII